MHILEAPLKACLPFTHSLTQTVTGVTFLKFYLGLYGVQADGRLFVNIIISFRNRAEIFFFFYIPWFCRRWSLVKTITFV